MNQRPALIWDFDGTLAYQEGKWSGAMLIGNTNLIPTGLTATGNTMASVIANQFGEADGLKLSSLVAIGLLLFIITAVINLIGRLILRKFR